MVSQTTHRFWRSPALPFAESRCANDSTACYAPHAHPMLSIGAVDGGSSIFTRDGTNQRLTRGDVVLIPAGVVHACNPENDGAWSYQMLYLDTAWAASVVGEMGELDAIVMNRLPPDIAPQRIHERLTALNECLFSPVADEDKETALLLFVGDLFASGRAGAMQRDARPDVQRMRAVMSMIERRYAEALSLDELARAAGMSRYHFVRTFSRAAGMTPHAWQIDLRIQRARKLLDDGMTLAETALQLGFSDQSHFQREFKRRVAATPGEYQRNIVQDGR